MILKIKERFKKPIRPRTIFFDILAGEKIISNSDKEFIWSTILERRDICYSAFASDLAKNQEGIVRSSAAAKNKARLRNRVRRAQQSDDLPLWKGWI